MIDLRATTSCPRCNPTLASAGDTEARAGSGVPAEGSCDHGRRGWGGSQKRDTQTWGHDDPVSPSTEHRAQSWGGGGEARVMWLEDVSRYNLIVLIDT